MAEEEKIELSDADALSCVLGYFLDEIEFLRKQATEIAKRNVAFNSEKNIFQIYKENITEQDLLNLLPGFNNLITKKDKEQKICNLNIFKDFKENQLFFNQITPSINLYKIVELENQNFIELKIPFDTVAGQKYSSPSTTSDNDYVEKLLKGGSGNAVGISDFSWKTEGRNEGNNTVYTVNFKVILQNISELETIRNVDSETGIQVTLLDLLYPPRKSGKFTSNPNDFEPEKMFVKADVGWNLPEEYKKYEKFFKTSLYLYLYKHNFSFQDSGKVELTLTYIGNIETIFNDKTKYDIFMSENMQKISELKTVLEQIINTPTTDLNTLQNLIYNADGLIRTLFTKNKKMDIFKAGRLPPSGTTGMGPRAGASYGGPRPIKKLSTAPEEAKEKLQFLSKEIIGKTKTSFFAKILTILLEKKLIYTIKLEQQQFQDFKSFISSENINSVTLESLKKTTKQLNKTTIQADSVPRQNNNIFNKPNLEEGIKENKDINKYIIDYKEIYEELNNSQSNIQFVNYVYLDDLIKIIIEESAFIEKDINIFFGPYSYRNYKSLTNINNNKTKRPLKKVYVNNSPKYYQILQLEKKVGYISHIPISLNVLINWYNEDISKSDETGYSFFEFLKKCFNTLIPQSIGSKNAPNAPEQNVITTKLMFNNTYENFKNNILKYTGTQIEINDLNNYYNSRENPIKKENMLKNIFYLSANEDDMTIFKGNEEEDCNLEIFHIKLNDINSFVKKANFKRDDNQKLETANLLTANKREGNKIIRQVYHCDLQLYGNNFFEPGNLIYIKPNYPGINLSMDILYDIGLGGYYRVIEVNNEIGVGSYNTNLNCRWEMFGGGKTDSDIYEESPPDSELLYTLE